MPSTGEFQLIDKIRRMFPAPGNITGIGDDAAVIENGFLVTTDALCEGTHFLSKKTDFTQLGYKAMAVNVSDIAAMGGKPLYALLTLGLSKKTDDLQIDGLLQGMKQCSDEFSFSLIGGDTVLATDLFISVTMIGKPYRSPILRSGAKEGDHIYVSGSLGDSAIGLQVLLKKIKFPVADRSYFLNRHAKPEPRVRLMEHLVDHYPIRSCIDCSDGFLADLGHICEMSGKGFKADLNKLPLSAGRIGKSFQEEPLYFLELAAGGGEDYELIFTSPEVLDTEEIKRSTGIPVTKVGLITGDSNRREISLNGKPIDMKSIKTGFKHF